MSKARSSLRANQIGDTMISVIMAMAVLALVMVTIYTLIQRSYRISQRARERLEVVRLLESQMESLKALVVRGEADVIYDKFVYNETVGGVTATHYFCFDDNGQLVLPETTTDDASLRPLFERGQTTPGSGYQTNFLDSNLTDTECEKLVYDTGPERSDLYYAIHYRKDTDGDPLTDEDLFVIEARWAPFGGGTTPEEASFSLRLHNLKSTL